LVLTVKLHIDDEEDEKRKMEEIRHWKQQQGHERVSALGHLRHLTVAILAMYACHSGNKSLCVLKAKVFPSYIPPNLKE